MPASKMLFIGAHPDDVEIGCAGTVARYIREGRRCHFITLTRGEATANPRIRAVEAQRAASELGADLTLLSYPDTKLRTVAELVRVIDGLASRIKPESVFIHSSLDLNEDHQVASRASQIACRRISNIYEYTTPETPPSFAANLYVKLSKADVQMKAKALKHYSSQSVKTGGNRYVESYRVVKQTQ